MLRPTPPINAASMSICSTRDRRPRQKANWRSPAIGENWVYSPRAIRRRDTVMPSTVATEDVRTVPHAGTTTLPRSRRHPLRGDETRADAVAALTARPYFPDAEQATA